MNTILKDPKYKGKAIRRDELFEGSSRREESGESDEEDEGLESDLDDEGNLENGVGLESESDMSVDETRVDEISSSEMSDASEELEEDGLQEEQDDRRNKVRALLAQETK